MPSKDGIITRKDTIEEDVFLIGSDYAKAMEPALKANKELVASVKELNKVVQEFKVAQSQKDYITAKQAQTLESQKAIDAIKQQEAAEISANKIKLSSIKVAEEERKANDAARASEEKTQKAKQASIKLTIEERIQNEINNKMLKQEALERMGLLGAYQKLNNERTKAKNTLRDLMATEGASIIELAKARAEFEKLDAKVRAADRAVGDFTKNVGNYPQLKSLAGMLRDLTSAFGIATGVAAFANVMKAAFETVKEFNQSLADLSAITGATGDDLDFLKNKAIELGDGTKGGAKAVLEAYKLIASAKPELLENVEALNKVTEATILLAKASGLELPDAATRLTDALNQFGAGADQAAVFADALANGAKYGSAEIPQLTDAVLKFGAVARSQNVNIQQSAALVELLAENGLKGADAGTALRNVMLKISAPDALPKKAIAAFDRFGISMDTLNDKTVPFQKKLEILKPLLNDNAALVQIFGLENIVAARNVIEHTDRLEELTGKMYENGTANEQAKIRVDTLQGATDRLESTWDDYIISLSESTSSTSFLTRAVSFLGDNLKEIMNVILKLGSIWLTYLITTRAVNFVMNAYRAIQVAATAAQIAFTTATGIGTVAMKAQAEAAREAAIAQEALNVATKATPWGLIIGLLAAAVAGYIAFSDSMSKAEEAQKKMKDEAERFRKQEASSSKESDEFRDKRFKQIEDEIALRRAKGEDSKKLDEEEIQRKAKIVLDEYETYAQTKEFQIQQTKNAIAESEKRIIQMNKEKVAALENSKKVYKTKNLPQGEIDFQDRRFDTSGEKEKLAQAKAFLELNTKLAAAEKEKLNNILLGLTKKGEIDKAEAEEEESKKAHAARLKRQKERYEAEKRAADNSYKLAQYRLQVAIEIDNEIEANEKESLEARLEANFDAAQLMTAQKRNQAEKELQDLGKYNEETGKFERQLSDEQIAIFLETGQIKTRKLKEATAEMRLIYEQNQNDTKNIDKKALKDKQSIIDSEVKLLKEEIDRNAMLRDTELQNALAAEGQLYAKKLADAKGNHALIEEATREHERRILEIKKASAKDILQFQIDAIEKLLEEDKKAPKEAKISAKEREKIEHDLAVAKKLQQDSVVENAQQDADKILFYETENYKKIEKASKDLTSALSVLANALFDARISNIDAEIQKNNEKYDKEILLAGDDQRKKDLLQKQQQKKNEELEKKKRAEQHKQAVFNKALKIAEGTYNLAAAVTAALTAGPGVGIALAAITAAIAGAELATIIATPIPKYKMGRQGGPEEIAIVGDGGVREVISRPDGSDPRVTPATSSLAHLRAGDVVHSSVEAYKNFMRKSTISQLTVEQQKTLAYQGLILNGGGRDKDLLEELRRNTKAIENSKQTIIVNTEKTDINHEIWKMGNTVWNR